MIYGSREEPNDSEEMKGWGQEGGARRACLITLTGKSMEARCLLIGCLV